jgi:hypothetical protein
MRTANDFDALYRSLYPWSVAVTLPAVFLLAAYFFVKWDISCAHRNAKGPKIANTILISGCL